MYDRSVGVEYHMTHGYGLSAFPSNAMTNRHRVINVISVAMRCIASSNVLEYYASSLGGLWHPCLINIEHNPSKQLGECTKQFVITIL